MNSPFCQQLLALVLPLHLYEYQKLIRVYPNSDYVDDAQFKKALSYFELSPKYSLDQDYTNKAVEEFEKFLEDFPKSELMPDVKLYMRKCREKLAKKYYENAQSYYKIALFESAIIYYDYVLDNFYDTEFAQKSLLSKAECYKRIGESDQAIKFYRL